MTVKVFKAVWLLSLLAVTAVLLYVYASLPEELQVTEGTVPFTLTRNGLFYLGLSFLAILNGMIFIFSRVYRGGNPFFAAWLYGLVCLLHLQFVVMLQFFNLYNSQEKFEYSSIGYIIYGSVSLVVVWFTLWPLYFIGARFFNKPAV